MRYNIRGQLLTINNSTLTNDMTTNKTNDDTNDLFGMELSYNSAGGMSNTLKYNGKLTGEKWMSKNGSGTATKERSYKFTYDDLDRYTAETYGERVTAGSGSFTNNLNGFDEYGITYDAGGNITHLNRKSSTVGGGTVTVIDNMTYTYDTANLNQLKTVTDAGTSAGFVGGTGNYVYDANCGNLTTDPYKHLGIIYDVLNRTDKITVTNATNRYIDYTYGADGSLLRKRQYDNGTLQKTTDYIDGFLYENSALVYFPMPEGRVLVSGGGTTFTQEFVITDQQGNARLSFQNNAGTAKAMQENSYYGFGMTMTSAMGVPGTPNKRLYNGGSEWQNDYNNSPDYYQTYYRNYDAALGRFVAVDPMAEATESLSVYHYSGNNPIMMNDPMGDVQKGPGTYITSGLAGYITDILHSGLSGTWTNNGDGTFNGTVSINSSEDAETLDNIHRVNQDFDYGPVGGSAIAADQESSVAAIASGQPVSGPQVGSATSAAPFTWQGVNQLAEVTVTADKFAYAGNLYHLPADILPKNDGHLTQVWNTCVFCSIAEVMTYFGFRTTGLGVLRAYAINRSNLSLDYKIRGHGATNPEISLAFNDFLEGYRSSDVALAIAKGFPVLSYFYMPEANMNHMVMITGISYFINGEFPGLYYTFYNSATGTYQSKTPNSFNFTFVVTGLANF